MAQQDILDLVSYFIGSFILGYGFGFLNVSFQRLLDKI